MPVKPPSRPPPRHRPVASEGRSAVAEPAKRGSLRWVREVLGRSIRLEQRRNQLHVTLVDPRRESGQEPALPLLMQQRAELGARLLIHDPLTQAVRNLFLVHDKLRAGGWASVETLPAKVVERALIEAEILADHEPSELLAGIIVNLRELKLAADERAAQEALEKEWETRRGPEVSDTNFDEYELMERSWAGTVPAGLQATPPPQR